MIKFFESLYYYIFELSRKKTVTSNEKKKKKSILELEGHQVCVPAQGSNRLTIGKLQSMPAFLSS